MRLQNNSEIFIKIFDDIVYEVFLVSFNISRVRQNLKKKKLFRQYFKDFVQNFLLVF